MVIASTPELQKFTVVKLKEIAKRNKLSGYSKLRKAEIIKLLRINKLKSKSKSPEKKSKTSTSLIEIASTPELQGMTVVQLRNIAKKNKLSGYSKFRKAEFINFLRKNRLKNKTKSPQKKASTSPKPSTQDKIKENYIKIIGPPRKENKYGLLKSLGAGKYGETFIARNLNKTSNKEADYYAVKIMKNTQDSKEDWNKEVQCLIDIYKICNDVGILCYHESFVSKNEYVIVTEYLDGYVLLHEYLYDKNKKTLMFNRIKQKYPSLSDAQIKNKVIEEVENIYSQIVEVKNKLTSLCISHSDLHLANIMYHPDKQKVKVIDLGKCQTPAEEKKEYSGPNKVYTDMGRLNILRLVLYNNIINSSNAIKPHGESELKNLKYFKKYKINVPKQKCVRKKELPPKN